MQREAWEELFGTRPRLSWPWFVAPVLVVGATLGLATVGSSDSPPTAPTASPAAVAPPPRPDEVALPAGPVEAPPAVVPAPPPADPPAPTRVAAPPARPTSSRHRARSEASDGKEGGGAASSTHVEPRPSPSRSE